MPAIEDWKSNPLDIIKNLFEPGISSDVYMKKVQEYFQERLQSAEAAAWILSLNSHAQHDLRTDSLVSFRCMVQDMFDPEYYLGAYEVKDTRSGESRLVSGMFQDLAQCKEGEQLELESPKNVTMDRQTLYCVPIPGETAWVKSAYAKKLKASSAHGASTSSVKPTSSKRSLDDEQENEISMDTETELMPPPLPPQNGASGDAKRTKTKPDAEKKSNVAAVDLNFPLPGEKGPACLVKVYGEWDALRVNDMIEVVGVLSNDPVLARFNDDASASAFTDPAEDMMECSAEENARSPPPSLVPRIHAICINKLQHNNPLLPADPKAESSVPVTSALRSEIEALHVEMMQVLTQALLGDHVAAQYLLCNLISTVYARHDVVPVGKFSLNLSGCPRDSRYAAGLHKILSEVVTSTHYLPMTLENMNQSRFNPKKDYQANRLCSGVLQLSKHTLLVGDETAMQAGQLDATGVCNLTALGNVVRWQKAEYDFDFHKQDFETDVPVVIMSEGKSMIQCDSQVVLIPVTAVDDIPAHLEKVHSILVASPLLDKLRGYVSYVRHLEYSLADDVQKQIEEDFVAMRKENSKNLTIDDFHGLLILARLISLSRGQVTLNEEIWNSAKRLEEQRKQRLRQINAPPS